MEIKLKGCTIRNFREGDEQALVKHANNKKVWINLRDFFPHPYTISDAKNWINNALHAEPCTVFAIEVNGEAAGGIGFHIKEDVYRRSAEIGYWLGEEHWGKGIAALALKAVSKYAFENYDLVRLYAGVYEYNSNSIRVLEKAGYLFEGRLRKAVTKNGTTVDELLFALIKQ